GLEPVEALLEPQRVRAQLDRLAELEHLRHHLVDPLVHERLAAADRDDGGGALDGGVDAFLDRKTRPARLVLADLPAADAGDVAREGRLEHEHERIALALPLLRGDVLADRDRRCEGELHPANLSLNRPSAKSGNVMR